MVSDGGSSTVVVLTVPTVVYREWVAAARDAGHTVDGYLVDTVTIATRLKLLEGVQRLPRRGAAIDPLLAEAVRVHAAGKPWQHKVDLLLATPGLRPERVLPDVPDPGAVRPLHAHVAQQLMARHGLPVREPKRRSPYAVVGGCVLTWNETALVLAVWDHAQSGWTGRRLADHAAAAGLPNRTVEPTIRNLTRKGVLEQRPNPGFVSVGPHRTGRSQYRVHPDVAAALATTGVRGVPV